MTEIIPAIITKDFRELEEKIRAVEPYVNRVHLDIMDGLFVENQTIDGVDELNKIETDLDIEVHLMVSKPENHIPRWLTTKADKFLVHWESTREFQKAINPVKDNDKIFGAVLNPDTGHDVLKEFSDQIDLVQFMTVHPGAYGAEFVESVLEKITDFHFFYPDIPIEVDGGVSPGTAGKIVDAGASMLVSGSYIYESPNIEEAINNLRESLNEE